MTIYKAYAMNIDIAKDLSYLQNKVVAKVNQNDYKLLKFVFNIYEYKRKRNLNNISAKFSIKKPDLSYEEVDCTIDLANSIISVIIDVNLLSYLGNNDMKLKILHNSTIIKEVLFKLEVIGLFNHNHNLSNLLDVLTSETMEDGSVLIFDKILGKWKPGRMPDIISGEFDGGEFTDTYYDLHITGGEW